MTTRIAIVLLAVLATACGPAFTDAAPQDDAGSVGDPPPPDAQPGDAGRSQEADSAPDTGADNRDAAPQPDSGTDGQDGDQPPADCNPGSACPEGQVCVTKTTTGGSCNATTYIANGGACPTGTIECGSAAEGDLGCVVHTVVAQCENVPASCHGAPACGACGSDLCGSCDCTGATDATAACGCAAP